MHRYRKGLFGHLKQRLKMNCWTR